MFPFVSLFDRNLPLISIDAHDISCFDDFQGILVQTMNRRDDLVLPLRNACFKTALPIRLLPLSEAKVNGLRDGVLTKSFL